MLTELDKVRIKWFRKAQTGGYEEWNGWTYKNSGGPPGVEKRLSNYDKLFNWIALKIKKWKRF